MSYCPNCGNKLEPGQNFCLNCGQKPSQEKPQKAPTKRPKNKRRLRTSVLVVVLIIVIAAVAIGVIIGLHNPPPPPPIPTQTYPPPTYTYQPPTPTYTYQPSPTYTPSPHTLISNETISAGYHNSYPYTIEAGKSVTISWSASSNVDVYIFTDTDYNYWLQGSYICEASKTSSSGTLSYKVPNTGTYYLVIKNPNTLGFGAAITVSSATASW